MNEVALDHRKKRILIVEDQYIEAHNLEIILQKNQYEVFGMARSYEQALVLIQDEQPDLVFLDIFLKGNRTGIDLARILREKHIGFIFISANSGKAILDEAKLTQPYGFIVKPFREEDVVTTLEIASYRHNNNIELQLLQEKILQKNIEAISSSHMKWEDGLIQIGKTLQTYIPFDYVEAGSRGGHYNSIGILRKTFDDFELIPPERFSKISSFDLKSLSDFQIQEKRQDKFELYAGVSFQEASQQLPLRQAVIQTFGIKTFIVAPIQMANHEIFYFQFYSRNAQAFTIEHVNLLRKLEPILSNFLATNFSNDVNIIPAIPINKNKGQSTKGFESMIGTSPKIVDVYGYITKVAPSETSVLILGESGTGKEKVAQSIHKLSSRKDQPFVVINCGAIPDNLAESLLFGHEKGAFTGALERRTGKFEQAEGGTLFLDEIGEMPMELQVKLLRVLQEKEIERVGGKAPVKINVRIIAATNKNLEECVAAGRFRLDLYYRLYVFPIMIPPLRERKDDIVELAEHFIALACKESGRALLTLSDFAVEQMMRYEWPGNIRELEHIIYRSILLADGNVLKEIYLNPTYGNKENNQPNEFSLKTIHENERDYISFILKRCKGKVSGSGGAAELLAIPASTLNSKIKKLGIKSREG